MEIPRGRHSGARAILGARFGPLSAFAFAILQTQSRSDIRDRVTLFLIFKRHWIAAFAGMTTKGIVRALEVGHSRTCRLKMI